MKKSILVMSLLSGTAFCLTGINIASGNPTHTHTYTPELKPISQNYIKFAAVCFLGTDNCGSIGFGKGDADYSRNPDAMCQEEGFVSTCPAGQKFHKDKRCPYNSSYGTCCTESCPTNSSTTCDGSVVGEDGCGYPCKSCDPCPGYYECGGQWQYCTGTTCYKDTSRCSNYCSSDYFPNKCDNKSDCKGVYRNGYCSGSCTPACVETCNGDSNAKSGEGWSVSSCTTCDGKTLYNNSAKSCQAGYSTSVSTCSTGYNLTTSGKSGDSICGKCTDSACPTGYSTDVTSCQSGYTLTTSGKSGDRVCGKCDCTLTETSCTDTYEATQSCVKNGVTYYKCELCHRQGGSAEGLYYCYNNDGRPSYGFTPVSKVSKVCGNKNYRTSCGCEAATYFNRPYIGTTGYGYVAIVCGARGYRGNYINNLSLFYRGYVNDACEENGKNVGFNKCAAYQCTDSGYKVVESPYDTCSVNENVCCCPEGYTGSPNSQDCKKVVSVPYIP